jgi:hypothetical protein
MVDCVNYGEISAEKMTLSTELGGICGRIGSAANFEIRRCANYGNIRGGTFQNQGLIDIGGIVGKDYSNSKGYQTMITDCYNMGNIYLDSSHTQATVGGITGNASGSQSPRHIINCYNVGKLIRSTLAGKSGGIIGSHGTNIFCANTYFLEGRLIRAGVVQPDVISGETTQPEIDGTSTPARTNIQSSGAKTLDQLQPLFSDLQDGTSAFYTGSTVADGITFTGYDPDTVWSGTRCRGLPYLRSLGSPEGQK